MPKVTVYIRKEDYELWKAVKEKTGFLHNALNGEGFILETGEDPQDVKPAMEIVKGLFPQAKEICKIHGTPMTTQGKCLQKGCKYA